MPCLLETPVVLARGCSPARHSFGSLFTPHCLNRIGPLDLLPIKGLSGERSRGISACNARLLRAEVQHEIIVAIAIHVLDVPLPVRFRGPIGAKPDTEGINGGRVEGARRQDGYRDYPLALGVDTVGEAAGLDVDLDW